MIPKIIHYIWLGGAEISPQIKDCMNSWKEAMPDYKIMRWDETSIKDIDNVFMREALSQKKWAFASDVIRLYALYRYGGIYLDTDVQVFKPFDNLLEHRMFTGRENSIHITEAKTSNYLTSCCMGAEPAHPFIARFLKYYENRHFILSEDTSFPAPLRYDMTLNTYVMAILAGEYGYDMSALHKNLQNCQEGLTVYPSQYFDPASDLRKSYCKHFAIGSWREKKATPIKYTLGYKISWRIWHIISACINRFDRIIIKLN